MSSAPETGGAGQLALRLPLDDEATLENFLPTVSVKALVAGLAQPTGEPLQFLHGPAAVGKSHLLQASCRGVPPGAVYLPLHELAALDPLSLLQDLEQAPLLAIDDLHCVAGDAGWEEGLFHLLSTAGGGRIPESIVLPDA